MSNEKNGCMNPIKMFWKLSLVVMFFLINNNISAQDSALPPDWPVINNKLGILEINNNELDINDAIPINVSYENRTISYSPSFRGQSHEYLGRKYYISIRTPGKTETKSLLLVHEHYVNIFTNETGDYDLRKDNNYGDASPYFDEANRECDFNLGTVSTEERTTSQGTKLRFVRATFNATDNCIDKSVYSIFKTFEFKNNGNIETFNITSYKGGNRLFGFIAKSTYTQKPYLFIYSVTLMKLEVYDLNSLAISNKAQYNINDCTLHSIFPTNGFRHYVFLQFGDKILPLTVFQMSQQNSKVNVLENSATRLGEYDEFLFKGWSGNIFGLWNKFRTELDGFVSVLSEGKDANNLNYKIKLYDKNVNIVWETTLSSIKITDVHESDGFLIIGGFTKNKGYVGFPNPRVVVINKTTKEITYDNVIPLKNGTIVKVSSDDKGNIEFTTAIWSGSWNYTVHFPLTPQVILDKLDTNGKFVNNLFQN